MATFQVEAHEVAFKTKTEITKNKEPLEKRTETIATNTTTATEIGLSLKEISNKTEIATTENITQQKQTTFVLKNRNSYYQTTYKQKKEQQSENINTQKLIVLNNSNIYNYNKNNNNKKTKKTYDTNCCRSNKQNFLTRSATFATTSALQLFMCTKKQLDAYTLIDDANIKGSTPTASTITTSRNKPYRSTTFDFTSNNETSNNVRQNLTATRRRLGTTICHILRTDSLSMLITMFVIVVAIVISDNCVFAAQRDTFKVKHTNNVNTISNALSDTNGNTHSNGNANNLSNGNRISNNDVNGDGINESDQIDNYNNNKNNYSLTKNNNSNDNNSNNYNGNRNKNRKNTQTAATATLTTTEKSYRISTTTSTTTSVNSLTTAAVKSTTIATAATAAAIAKTTTTKTTKAATTSKSQEGAVATTTTRFLGSGNIASSSLQKISNINNNGNGISGINRNAIEVIDDQRNGPYFDKSASKNVTALLGKTAYLNCRVKNLGNKTMLLQVSWVRHRDIHLLTVGRYTYTSDQRFRAIHQPQTEDWMLQIKYPQHRDSGVYECQVSTTPHMSHYIHLNVVEPSTEIIGAPDLYIESGSTINLTCVILNSPEPPAYIFWNHNNAIINYDSPRGGVSVVTNKGETTTSFLLIKSARPSDSGHYQCNPSNAKPKSVTVHVLNGEFPAAMQRAVQAHHRMSPNHYLLMYLLIYFCTLLYVKHYMRPYSNNAVGVGVDVGRNVGVGDIVAGIAAQNTLTITGKN